MKINSRNLTENELEKIAKFYVKDDRGITENFDVDKALEELETLPSLRKAFDLKNNKVFVTRIWFNDGGEDLVERITEDYLIDGNNVEIVNKLDFL